MSGQEGHLLYIIYLFMINYPTFTLKRNKVVNGASNIILESLIKLLGGVSTY